MARPHLANPAWTLLEAAKIGYTDVPWPKQYLSGKTQLERNLEREKAMAAQALHPRRRPLNERATTERAGPGARRGQPQASWPATRPRHFLWQVKDAVATITLNRPERKNPLTFDSYAELRDLFGAAEVRRPTCTPS